MTQNTQRHGGPRWSPTRATFSAHPHRGPTPTPPRAPDTVDLTVVVPVYNEEHRLPRTLDAICRHLRSSPGRHPGWEVVVVDDGSTDGTADAVRAAAATEPRIRLLGPPPGTLRATPATGNHGKGHAVRLGVLATCGRRVLVTDADLATPIEELAALHDRLDEGYAAAIGSRAHPPEAAGAVRRHPLRHLLGEAGNRIIRAVAVPGVRDTQCGFKLFEGDRARAVFGRSRLDGWCIDVEILRMFHGARWPVAEVPVRWAHQPGSKVRAADRQPGAGDRSGHIGPEPERVAERESERAAGGVAVVVAVRIVHRADADGHPGHERLGWIRPSQHRLLRPLRHQLPQ
ncbi:dolichyl-phosphate beta-glucosyltransferase [Streptomyces cucumeris]|uniref:dolichyl-phosphate beta-glucosyltransferase n=1 Tax=Streptomyces cucumeris TaxID=2962890 RepID=UPI003D75B975